jgi:hypothetical protein
VPTLDGAGWHRLGDRPVVPENISLLHLPPYSPELNLVGMLSHPLILRTFGLA